MAVLAGKERGRRAEKRRGRSGISIDILKEPPETDVPVPGALRIARSGTARGA